MPKYESVTINRTRITALPPEQRKHGGQDDLCACVFCSPDGRSRDNPLGVWDALAEDLDTGKTWYVHAPELHGVRRKRPNIPCGVAPLKEGA